MKILGFTSMYHDSSACLLVDGYIVGYAEEERFNRKKHTPEHPQQAIEWVLAQRNLRLDDLDEVVYYLNPWKYLATGIKAALANFPKSLALAKADAATMPPMERVARQLRLKAELCRRHGARGDFKLVCVDHYRTHQASAFFASEFDDAAIVTMDFAVDGTTEVIAHGRGTQITDRVRHRVPNGFALVYATMTHVLGFKWYDEYKVMGMAAYGEPKYLDRIEQLYRHARTRFQILRFPEVRDVAALQPANEGAVLGAAPPDQRDHPTRVRSGRLATGGDQSLWRRHGRFGAAPDRFAQPVHGRRRCPELPDEPGHLRVRSVRQRVPATAGRRRRGVAGWRAVPISPGTRASTLVRDETPLSRSRLYDLR